MFAALGTDVTIVDQRPAMLDFCDREIVEALEHQLRDLGVKLRYRERVTDVVSDADGALARLDSGKRIAADVVLYSAGRQGNTETLHLERAGLTADGRGRLTVDDCFRTAVPHIYAVGDVIGFPALASTAMVQGRVAACHALGEPAGPVPDLVPVGIYTIPEISYVGRTEEELTADRTPYEVGIARYRELAGGQIRGDTHGLIKLLVAPQDGRLLGVHLFGAGATELVHIGHAVMATNGTVHHLVDMVLNVPTLAEGYKVAALDATNRLRTIDRRLATTGAPS
jgi:NAD(P) transhydrogenase